MRAAKGMQRAPGAIGGALWGHAWEVSPAISFLGFVLSRWVFTIFPPHEVKAVQPCADEAKVVQPCASDRGCILRYHRISI